MQRRPRLLWLFALVAIVVVAGLFLVSRDGGGEEAARVSTGSSP
jgi:hypothetical protein